MSFATGMGSWKSVGESTSSSNQASESQKRADSVMASLGKARVRAKASGWNWEDEEMMYEIDRRNLKRQKRKLDASKVTVEQKIEKVQERKRAKYMYEERKVFLGGLSEETTEKDVKAAFEVFGTIVDLKVMRDNETGKSRGYGFLTYAQTFMLDAAMEKGEFEICGATIHPKRATPDEPRYRMTRTEYDNSLECESICDGKRSIFVGALRDNITEDDLIEYFQGYGRVVRAHKLVEKETGIVHNYGFVDFAEFGVVRRVLNTTKHYIKGKRIRIDLSRRKIEFSLQTKTIYVGELADGIEDGDMRKYFSEFGFVVNAFRIPDQGGTSKLYGFVEFDAFDSVDIVVQQREHYIQGHRIRVDLALPIVNDMLYSDECAAAQENSIETWEEHVHRKLQYAIPDEGAWGEKNNYEIFVKGGPDVISSNIKIPRGMLEYVVGMAGKVIESIADDTGTRLGIKKGDPGSRDVIITITGKREGIKQATFIMAKIVKSNIHKLNLSSSSMDKTTKKKVAGITVE